jgi:hypothetical protein
MRLAIPSLLIIGGAHFLYMLTNNVQSLELEILQSVMDGISNERKGIRSGGVNRPALSPQVMITPIKIFTIQYLPNVLIQYNKRPLGHNTHIAVLTICMCCSQRLTDWSWQLWWWRFCKKCFHESVHRTERIEGMHNQYQVWKYFHCSPALQQSASIYFTY